MFLDMSIRVHFWGASSNSMYDEAGMEYKLPFMSRFMSGKEESWSWEQVAVKTPLRSFLKKVMPNFW